jgi:hypothetical protein
MDFDTSTKNLIKIIPIRSGNAIIRWRRRIFPVPLDNLIVSMYLLTTYGPDQNDQR